MSKRLITVYEDRTTRLELSDKEKQDIIALKELWGAQNLILQADGSLLMKHYVGFIYRNGTRVQILPKVLANGPTEKSDADTEVNKAVILLLRLLSYSDFLNIKEIPDPISVDAYQNDLLEIFIGMFAAQFNRLFNREIHRSYQQLEENMQFIKGKILFTQTIKENKFRKHLHYVSYEEFSINNLLNRIIKTTMLRLLSQTKVTSNKKALKLALIYLEEVEPIKLYPGIFDQVKFNRLNQNYLPLFNMAKMFYYNRQPGQSEGDEFTFTFLVPLNRLFEQYVYMLLHNSKLSSVDDYEVSHHKPQKYLAKRTEQNNKPVFLLEPDITLAKDGEVKVIIDAKYKNPIIDDNVIVFQNDIYQMLAYATAYHCPNIYLVYPAFLSNKITDNELAQYDISTPDGNVSIKIIQLDIIDTEPEEIQKQMEGIIMKKKYDYGQPFGNSG
ncbi:MAG: McrC family protein [Christensenellales bacterium]|jgi:5-methylcytosine-specific restriction enzyme subunit McrC